MSDKIYAKNPDVVFRSIAGQYILVPIRNKMGDLEYIYSLNEVAAGIWNLLKGDKAIGEIENVLFNEFEVSHADLKLDIDSFISDMEKEGLIELVL